MNLNKELKQTQQDKGAADLEKGFAQSQVSDCAAVCESIRAQKSQLQAELDMLEKRLKDSALEHAQATVLFEARQAETTALEAQESNLNAAIEAESELATADDALKAAQEREASPEEISTLESTRKVFKEKCEKAEADVETSADEVRKDKKAREDADNLLKDAKALPQATAELEHIEERVASYRTRAEDSAKEHEEMKRKLDEQEKVVARLRVSLKLDSVPAARPSDQPESPRESGAYTRTDDEQRVQP